MSDTTTYEPMKNDRRDFDPVAEEWSYILDDGGDGQRWRGMVPVNLRPFTWPYQLHTDGLGRNSYGYARLSPDWCFYSWHPEYVLAYWDGSRPHEVRCRLNFQRRYTDPKPELHKFSGYVTLDLLRQDVSAWLPDEATREHSVPHDVRVEAARKAAKLLAFFKSECAHWRTGDQERPVQAADLYREGR